jgi:hypothetical protein
MHGKLIWNSLSKGHQNIQREVTAIQRSKIVVMSLLGLQQHVALVTSHTKSCISEGGSIGAEEIRNKATELCGKTFICLTSAEHHQPVNSYVSMLVDRI